MHKIIIAEYNWVKTELNKLYKYNTFRNTCVMHAQLLWLQLYVIEII